MDFFIELSITGLLIIASTAFLASIGAFIVKIFQRRGRDHSIFQTEQSKSGWRKVER